MAIAYRSSGAFVDANFTTTGAIGLPAGLADGDVLVLVCQSRGTSGTTATPAGYTLPPGGYVQITNSHRLHVFYRYVASAGAESTPAVVQTVSGAIRARLSAFSGCSSTTQLDVAVQSAKSGAATSVVAPGISTATTGSMVVWCFSTGDDNVLTGATQGTTAYASDGTAGNDGSIALVYELQGAATSTGTCTMTESLNGPDNWCTVTLALRPTIAATPEPSWPFSFDGLTYAMEMAFGDSPFTPTPTWTDISQYVRAVGLDVNRGRNSVFSDIQPGTMSFMLDNRARRFDPDHAAGPYFGKLLPQVRCRLRVRKSSVTYPIFDGYVQGWPQEYDYPNEAVVPIVAVDLMSRLASRVLPPALLDAYCKADGAKGHWPLDESFGGTSGIAFDNSGYGADGQYNAADIGEGLLAGEPGRKDKILSYSDQLLSRFYSSDSAGLSLVNMRTLEFWIRVDQFTSAGVASDFVPEFAHGAPGGYVPPPVDPYIIVQCQSEVGLFDIEFRQYAIGTPGEFPALTASLYDATNTLVYTLVNPFPINETLHVVCVLNEAGTIWSVYLNGELMPQATGLSGTFEGGSREAGVSMTSVGYVVAHYAHFAVYDTELTAAQIVRHYSAGVGGGQGQYPSDRLEIIADAIGLTAAAQYDGGDLADHTYLSRAAFSGNALTTMQDIVRTEQGRMFVDALSGVLTVQGRTADIHDLAVNTTSQATLTDSGAWAYSQLTIDTNEIVLIKNTIRLSTNGGNVIVVDPDSVNLNDEQSESLTVLLDNAADAQSLGLYRTRQYAAPASRITSVVLKCHGPSDPKYAFCLAVELGWRVTITRTPQGIGSPITKVCHVEGIHHHVQELGPWETTLYLAPAQNTYTQQPWFVVGDATYGKIGAAAGNQIVY